MTREELIFKLNNIRMEINDGQHIDAQSEIVDIIRFLQSEPCEDAISREKTMQIVREWFDMDAKPSELFNAIEQQPSVTPKPRTGHWIGQREHCENLGVMPSGLCVYEWCSNCDCGIDVRNWQEIHHNYCPNCGAEMESEEKE